MGALPEDIPELHGRRPRRHCDGARLQDIRSRRAPARARHPSTPSRHDPEASLLLQGQGMASGRQPRLRLGRTAGSSGQPSSEAASLDAIHDREDPPRR